MVVEVGVYFEVSEGIGCEWIVSYDEGDGIIGECAGGEGDDVVGEGSAVYLRGGGIEGGWECDDDESVIDI